MLLVEFIRSDISGGQMTAIFVTGGRRTGTTLLAGILCADAKANPLIGEAPLLRLLVQNLQWARKPENFESFLQYSFRGEADVIGYFTAMIDQYVERTRAMQGNPEHVVLKSPEFSLVMEELVLAQPQALFVVSVRDPRDQITSDLEVQNKDDSGKVVGDGRQYRDIRAAAKTLNGYYAKVAAAERLAPERILYVRYEDVLEDFGVTLNRLNTFTGMSESQFDPARDWPRYAAISDLEPNYADYTPYFGKPLEASRIGRYRQYLDQIEVLQIEDGCEALMRRFGYVFSATSKNLTI